MNIYALEKAIKEKYKKESLDVINKTITLYEELKKHVLHSESLESEFNFEINKIQELSSMENISAYVMLQINCMCMFNLFVSELKNFKKMDKESFHILMSDLLKKLNESYEIYNLSLSEEENKNAIIAREKEHRS